MEIDYSECSVFNALRRMVKTFDCSRCAICGSLNRRYIAIRITESAGMVDQLY